MLGALLIVLSGCAALRKAADPVTGLVKRGSCISIDLPPITLTPERTAAERQLVGENRELEPNGWLLASAQSASRYGGTQAARVPALEEVRRLQREHAVLEYYEQYVQELLGRGALGETPRGFLAVPPAAALGAEARRVTRSDRRRAETIAREVNQARSWVYEYHKTRAGTASKAAQEEVFRRYLRIYWDRAAPGTWVLNPDGRWVRRQ